MRESRTPTTAAERAANPSKKAMVLWLAIALLFTVGGYVVAALTGDDTPPYEDSVVSEIAWHSFVSGTLTFVILLLVVAGSWTEAADHRETEPLPSVAHVGSTRQQSAQAAVDED